MAPREQQQVADDPNLRRGRPTAVVAEDDDDLRIALAAGLRQNGFDVVEIPDGEGLIGFLGTCEMHQRPPDVIISDLRMPGYNGVEVLEGLKAAGWKVPVILMTAFADPKLRRRAEQLGVTAIFDKPFDLDVFLAAVYCSLAGEKAFGSPS